MKRMVNTVLISHGLKGHDNLDKVVQSEECELNLNISKTKHMVIKCLIAEAVTS